MNQKKIDTMECIIDDNSPDFTYNESSEPFLPPCLIGEAIAPFLNCRQSFINLSLVNKELYRICQFLNPPWPSNLKLSTKVNHCQCICFSPDQTVLSCGGNTDGSIQNIHVHNGDITLMDGHVGEVLALVYSPCGKYLASGGIDKNIRLWDMSDKRNDQHSCLCIFMGHTDSIRSLQFAPSLRATQRVMTIVSGSTDKTARVWQYHQERKTGASMLDETVISVSHEILNRSGADDAVDSIAFSSSGEFMALASWDGQIQILSCQNKEETTDSTYNLKTVLKGHDGSVRSVAFLPRKKYSSRSEYELLASASDDGTICLFSPDGSYLVSASDDRTIRVWEIKHHHHCHQQGEEQQQQQSNDHSPMVVAKPLSCPFITITCVGVVPTESTVQSLAFTSTQWTLAAAAATAGSHNGSIYICNILSVLKEIPEEETTQKEENPWNIHQALTLPRSECGARAA